MSYTEKSAGASLRSVINEVIKEKLDYLEKQKLELMAHFAIVLDKHREPENRSSLKFLKEIYTTLLSAHSHNPIPMVTKELSAFMNWIDGKDGSGAIYFGSSHLINAWIDTLVKHIKLRVEKLEYSCLYANVMSQYMESKSLAGTGETKISAPITKAETIQEFTRLVFSDTPSFSLDKFEDFIKTQLFDETNPVQKNILNNARKTVQAFCNAFDEEYHIDTHNLSLCIQGMLRTNLLSKDKTNTLKELLENSAALEEVSNIVDKRIKDYTQWTWSEPIYVEFRRNIAGRYRVCMDEDIIRDITLHYLGTKWIGTIKLVLKNIYTSPMWKRESDAMGMSCKIKSIEGYRQEFHKASFLSILNEKFEDLALQGVFCDDDDDDDDDGENDRDDYSRWEYAEEAKEISSMEVKNKVLHLISNEIHLNNVICPEKPITVVQTNVEWFVPSIVHQSVLSVMKFFGVTDHWLAFFKKFLEVPLRIESNETPIRIRKRGPSISHAFTVLFEETILFIMDLYVNQVSGLNVHRIQDDYWFWSRDQAALEKAWTAIQTFVKLADLKLNEEKSASVVCSSDATPDMIISAAEPLPQGQVKWGFVVLHSDGVYRISKSLLVPHVKKMRECLVQAQTVMSWVHSHNKYIRFFVENFVEPAKTLQKQHIVQILESLRAILTNVHVETKGDAVAALKLKFSDILGDKEIIDSWVYWPVQKGGLNLHNPFLDLIPLLETYRKSEENSFLLGRFQAEVNVDEEEWKRKVGQSNNRRKWRQGYDSSVALENETITDDEEDYDVFGNGKDLGRFQQEIGPVGRNWPRYFEHSDNQPKKRRIDNSSMALEDETTTGHGEEYLSRGNMNTRRKKINFTTWCTRNREFRSSRWWSHYVDLLNPIGTLQCESVNWRQWLYSGMLETNLGYKEDQFVDSKLVPLSLISNAMEGERVHKN